MSSAPHLVDPAPHGRVGEAARVSAGRDGVSSWPAALTTAGRRARRRLDSHPFAVDAAIAVAVALFALGGDVIGGDSPTPAWVFDVVLALPLLVRRRWPAGTFVAVSAVALIQWLTDTPANGDLAVLVALYGVGAYERRRWMVAAAAAVGGLGVVLAVVRWAPPGATPRATVLLSGTVTAALVIGVYVRTRRAYLASILDRVATAEHQRDQQSRLAVAAERTRIAREMHDVVAHSLSVMIALSDGAATAVRTSPDEAQDVMQQASGVGRQALGDMRRLLGVLRAEGSAELSPQPSGADLEELVAGVRSAGFAVELVVGGTPQQAPPGAQLAVYRIVQESLTNVLKHAPDAGRAVVAVTYTGTDIDIRVTNDDRKPPRRPYKPAQGHGLTGMRERAAVYGGLVHAGRTPDGGWLVSTRLKLDGTDAPP